MDETSTTSSSGSASAGSSASPGSAAASSNASTTSSSNASYPTPVPGGLPIPPPLLTLLFLAGGLILHSFSHAPRAIFAHHILGLLLVAGGVLIAAYAAALFQARKTGLDPHGEATAFVIETPYTFTRNPMYLGQVLVLFGFAVFFASIAMLLAPIAFFVVIDRMVIPLEEYNLERIFGAQYVDYKTRVRRWL
jgi:protein-S-isoprenylcysteine O-methyltransferase Ste14